MVSHVGSDLVKQVSVTSTVSSHSIISVNAFQAVNAIRHLHIFIRYIHLYGGFADFVFYSSSNNYGPRVFCDKKELDMCRTGVHGFVTLKASAF